ncbi:MAG: PEGA domain-containing protein [Candidatus Paceibacterota bacterium]
MNAALRSLSTVVLMCLVFGCGTIMQGTTQEVGVTSNPSDATVAVNGESRGTTPLVLDLKRKGTYLVTLELDGYEPYETTLTRSTSGWVWGNILFGGLAGLAVDAVTGGMYKLTPEQIVAEFRRTESAATILHDDGGIYIAVVMQPRADWEKIGVLRSSESEM